MKKLLLFALVLLSLGAFSQTVTSKEIKTYKIKKVLEASSNYDGTSKKFWYFDRKGYDSLQSNFDDTATVYNTFKSGKLVKKLIAVSQKPEKDHVDSYTYEYDADGGYKENYRDGAFGMLSYEWRDAKGKILKSQSPDGNTTTYKYNASGKLLTVTSDGNNGGTKINNSYSYNAKGQLQKKEAEIDGGKSVTNYAYNTKGQLIKEFIKGGLEGEDSETTIAYEYNEKGLLRKKIINSNGSTTTVDYTYEYY